MNCTETITVLFFSIVFEQNYRYGIPPCLGFNKDARRKNQNINFSAHLRGGGTFSSPANAKTEVLLFLAFRQNNIYNNLLCLASAL